MRRALVVLVWAALLAAGVATLRQAPIETDPLQFLPRADFARELLDIVRGGSAGRLVLIGIEGDTEASRAVVAQRLADRLRASGLFTRVLERTPTLDRAEQQRLFAWRYLLGPPSAADDWEAPALRGQLEQRLRELRSPLSVLTAETLAADPTGASLRLLAAWQGGLQPPPQRLGVWFSADGKRALLLAETRASGFETEAQAAAAAAVHTGFAAAAAGTATMLKATGAGLLAAEAQRVVRADAERLGLLAGALMIALMLLAYRSLRPLLVSALPLAAAIVAGWATTAAVFGSVHGTTLGFGITLMGVTLDYPVLLFSRKRAGVPAAQGVGEIWPTLRLCAATTVVGYLPMLNPGFESLMQLAVFSAAGVLAAVAATRTLVPVFVPARWGPPAALGRGAVARWMLRSRPRVTWGVVLAGGAIVLTLAVVAPPAWEDDLGALNPLPRALLDADRQLRADLGAPEAGHLVLIRGATAEAVLQASERAQPILRQLQAEGALRGFDSPSAILPSADAQRQRQQALPAPEKLQGALAEAQAGLAFAPGLFAPFLNAVASARIADPVTPDDLAETPLAARLGTLLLRQNGTWVGLLPLSGVSDPPAIAAALAPLAADGVRVIDLRAETSLLLNDFRDAALLGILVGAVLLVAALWLALPNGRRALAVLLPVGLAPAFDLALLAATGERLSLFHLVSLLLVVGIGSDYALFFAVEEHEEDVRARTLHAVVVGCASTMIGFGALWLSELSVLRAIGQTVAVGVFASFVLALMITPLLAGAALRQGGERGPSPAS